MAIIEKPPEGGVAGLNITIVGLGLMGGSFAKALKRGTGATVTAFGRNAAALQAVLGEGVIDCACTEARDAVNNADLTVVCLNPGVAVQFIDQNMRFFKPGSVITDICGVKQPVIDGVLPHLRDDVDFVPGHPMAGRERSGYQYSVETLFDRCNYILTPLKRNKVYSIDLVKRFAGALGTGAIVLAGPGEHDEMIAFTSQLPHVLAVAYVLGAGERDPLPFSAGSFRDVSRVAAINAPMWAELFFENGNALLAEMESLQAGVGRITELIRSGDRQALTDILATAARMKEERL
jgi:prephenate dehydrogenase